jgi:glycosyltransferase involved in cell wall biosynthesis
MVDYREYGREETKEGKERKYVTLSNVNDNKGGNLLVQLAKALPDVEFLGVKGGYRKQITVSDVPNLKYIEHTPKIRDVYAQTWVQIMPSKEETWGRTAVEAMSSGIPVIVSPTPGLRECCESAAIYCDRNDLDAWVAAIRHLKRDGEHYKKMSTVALERARALDPVPDIERMEDWICGPVQESAFPVSRDPTFFEKNMLFR